jgi:hypothetical protein
MGYIRILIRVWNSLLPVYVILCHDVRNNFIKGRVFKNMKKRKGFTARSPSASSGPRVARDTESAETEVFLLPLTPVK